jgi:CRISPR-associated protein Csb1
MTDQISLNDVMRAMAQSAAAFRSRTTLQPGGGAGDKVFPPTYAGAVYATEKRRLPGRDEPVECVLLDSVQSQANRMEEALQQAVDDGRLTLPVIEVDFSAYWDPERQNKGLDEDMRLLDPVGKISSLQAPHRIADAILRDSLVKEDNKPFRHKDYDKESEYGHRLRRVKASDATFLFELCPTALLFGMWDSTGPKGGLGAKFERAMVSEIVGINAVSGVKTSSRIDPLGIQKNAGPLYRCADGRYTIDSSLAVDEMKDGKPTGRKLLYKKNSKGQDVFHNPNEAKFPDQGRPSEANHGNVTPDIDYRKDKNYNVIKDDNGRPIPVGGVTVASAEQTIVISLPALRRLRFPLEGKTWQPSKEQTERDNAARTVLAALGLCAAALADKAGLDLRSRCLLYPEHDLTWELLDRKGGGKFVLPADDAVDLFNEAVAAAKQAGLPWREQPLKLIPSSQLVKLVVKSQQLAVGQGGGEGGD